MQATHRDGVTVRALRDGDTATVLDLFSRLGTASRAARFGGAKPRLTDAELAALARVDGDRHVLVAYAAGDPRPAGIARLVRDGATAEIAVAVADAHQSGGVGRELLRVLAADARAAGITSFVATVSGDNPRVMALLQRIARPLEVTWSRGEREIRMALGA